MVIHPREHPLAGLHQVKSSDWPVNLAPKSDHHVPAGGNRHAFQQSRETFNINCGITCNQSRSRSRSLSLLLALSPSLSTSLSPLSLLLSLSTSLYLLLLLSRYLSRYLSPFRCCLRKAGEVACLLRGGHMTVALQGESGDLQPRLGWINPFIIQQTALIIDWSRPALDRARGHSPELITHHCLMFW